MNKLSETKNKPKMGMARICAVLILFLNLCHLGDCMSGNEVTPTCDRSKPVCEYTWVIENKQTMMLTKMENGKEVTKPVIWKDNAFKERSQCLNPVVFNTIDDASE